MSIAAQSALLKNVIYVRLKTDTNLIINMTYSKIKNESHNRYKD